MSASTSTGPADILRVIGRLEAPASAWVEIADLLGFEPQRAPAGDGDDTFIADSTDELLTVDREALDGTTEAIARSRTSRR